MLNINSQHETNIKKPLHHFIKNNVIIDEITNKIFLEQINVAIGHLKLGKWVVMGLWQNFSSILVSSTMASNCTLHNHYRNRLNTVVLETC